jgi:hypothetical protein
VVDEVEIAPIDYEDDGNILKHRDQAANEFKDLILHSDMSTLEQTPDTEAK